MFRCDVLVMIVRQSDEKKFLHTPLMTTGNGEILAMPKPISFTEMNAKTVASMEEVSGVPKPETPFRILIMGDFSGRANRGIFQPGDGVFEKSLHPVDRDNLDGLMARLGVEIRLPLAGEDNSPVVMRVH